MTIGDQVWVFIHDIGYVQIYKATITDKGIENWISVVYTEMIFDNDKDYSLVGKFRQLLKHNVFSTFDEMIEAMDEQLVIKDIMKSKKVAK